MKKHLINDKRCAIILSPENQMFRKYVICKVFVYREWVFDFDTLFFDLYFAKPFSFS